MERGEIPEQPKRGRGRPSNKGYEAMYGELCVAVMHLMLDNGLYENKSPTVKRVRDAITPEWRRAVLNARKDDA